MTINSLEDVAVAKAVRWVALNFELGDMVLVVAPDFCLSHSFAEFSESTVNHWVESKQLVDSNKNHTDISLRVETRGGVFGGTKAPSSILIGASDIIYFVAVPLSSATSSAKRRIKRLRSYGKRLTFVAFQRNRALLDDYANMPGWGVHQVDGRKCSAKSCMRLS